ncbi:MAG: DUF983 domain-containing protein [Actinomycetota bacterium]
MSGPFDDLDPRAGGVGGDPGRGDPLEPGDRPGVRRPSRPGAVTVFARGAMRQCPRCGGGRLFGTPFRIEQRCPRCGLRLEREEGGFLGAMTVNYAVTAVVWLAVLIAWLVVDLPDVHVAALTIASIAVAVVVPLLFWPTSKTIWAAVDYLVYRTDPGYASDAADRPGGNGGPHP